MSGILGLKNGLDNSPGAWPGGFLKRLYVSRARRHFDTLWPLLPNAREVARVACQDPLCQERGGFTQGGFVGRRARFATMLGVCVTFLVPLADYLITALKVIQAELSVQGHPWVRVESETSLGFVKLSPKKKKKECKPKMFY